MCFHCGQSDALDAEARKRKLKDMVLYIQFADHVLPLEKKSVRNAKKIRK